MNIGTSLYPTSRHATVFTNSFTTATIDVSAQQIGNASGRLEIEINDLFNSVITKFAVTGGYGYLNQPMKSFYVFDNSVVGFDLYASTTTNKPNYLKFEDSSTQLVYTFIFSANPAYPHTVQRSNPHSVAAGNVTITITVNTLFYYQ
jgi:hypothetical protein